MRDQRSSTSTPRHHRLWLGSLTAQLRLGTSRQLTNRRRPEVVGVVDGWPTLVMAPMAIVFRRCLLHTHTHTQGERERERERNSSTLFDCGGAGSRTGVPINVDGSSSAAHTRRRMKADEQQRQRKKNETKRKDKKKGSASSFCHCRSSISFSLSLSLSTAKGRKKMIVSRVKPHPPAPPPCPPSPTLYSLLLFFLPRSSLGFYFSFGNVRQYLCLVGFHIFDPERPEHGALGVGHHFDGDLHVRSLMGSRVGVGRGETLGQRSTSRIYGFSGSVH